MYNQLHEPSEILREGISGQRLMDDDVTASAVILAGKLERLKMTHPMFEGVSFSPDVEALLAAHMTAVAN